MKQVRVNVRCNAVGAIRREKRNGRDVVIVPSATMPDNIVMNDIMYPADEIAKSFQSLDRTPAPLGHPTINGMFVSARDPEGINLGWVGAWNENVRQEGGRVKLDKVIDVVRASESEGGKRVLDAIEKGSPIHTSTGLLAMMEEANGDVPYSRIAHAIEFDHDAILLDEDGAATPEQGVGMLVNRDGKQEEIEVVNSMLEMADEQLDWAVEELARAIERKKKASVLDKLKSMIMEAVGIQDQDEPSTEKGEEMDIEELAGKIDGLSAALTESIGKAVGDAVSNAVKPLVDAQSELKANQEAKDKAEKAGLVEKVVKANLLTEAVANTLDLAALKELAPKAEPGKAAGLNAAYGGGATDNSLDMLPEGDD